MFLLGLALFIAVAYMVIIMCGGDPRTFLDLPTLLTILFCLLTVVISTDNLKVCYGGIRAVVFPKEPLSDELRGQAASLFRLMSKSTAMISGIIALIGLINMLSGLGFYDSSVLRLIGANIAVVFISVLYGLVLIAAVFEPMVFILKKRRAV